MSTIRLKNIKIYAFHGCLIEESKIGSNYLVNISVKASLKTAAKSDDLVDTVDYVSLQEIVEIEMQQRSKLLEHVGQRIIDAVFHKIPLVTSVKVRVSKINPPIGGDVEDVSVLMKSSR